MTLPKGTIDIIKKQAVQADVKNQNKSWEYRAGYRAGNEDGATEWAGKAQGVSDALEEIAKSPIPANERERDSWIITARAIAVNALAKYKEVSNG